MSDKSSRKNLRRRAKSLSSHNKTGNVVLNAPWRDAIIEICDELDNAEAELAGRELMDAEADSFLSGKIVVDESEYRALEAENERLKKDLLDLTPGGSEFYDSPDNCVRFIADTMAVAGKVAAERNALREQLKDAS